MPTMTSPAEASSGSTSPVRTLTLAMPIPDSEPTKAVVPVPSVMPSGAQPSGRAIEEGNGAARAGVVTSARAAIAASGARRRAMRSPPLRVPDDTKDGSRRIASPGGGGLRACDGSVDREPPHLHRLAPPLHGHRPEGGPAARLAQGFPGPARHQHLVRTRHRHEAGGGVRRVADDPETAPAARAHVAHDGVAGAHADPEGRPARVHREDGPAGLHDRDRGPR